VAYLQHIDNGAVRNRSCALDAKVALSVSVAAAPKLQTYTGPWRPVGVVRKLLIQLYFLAKGQ
jgi:hypothetical protein